MTDNLFLTLKKICKPLKGKAVLNGLIFLLCLFATTSCVRKAASNADICRDDFTCSTSDMDEDGVLDGKDNCPMTPNPMQEDRDEDGMGDACDESCERQPDLEQRDKDEDGIIDVCDEDIDGDGVLNEQDNCPEDENPNQADLDMDGKGDICDEDTDGDGIPDIEDDHPYCSGLNAVLDLTNPRGPGGRIGDGRSPLTAEEFEEVPFSPCAIIGDVEMTQVEGQSVDIFEETFQLIGSLTISDNHELQHAGWPKLQMIKKDTNKNLAGNLKIENNSSLTSIGFDKLEKIEGNFFVIQNEEMQTLTLDKLEEVGSTVVINEETNRVEHIGGMINIRENQQLSTLSLNRLSKIFGLFYVIGNTRLSSLSNPVLKEVKRSVLILGNSQELLDEVQGLESIEWPVLTDVRGSLTVERNMNLQRMNCPFLDQVGGQLRISGNQKLGKLLLRSLFEVQEDLIVENNEVLSEIDLSGLNEVGLNRVVGGSLRIKDHPGLHTLQSQSLYQVSDSVEIEGNQVLDEIRFDTLSIIQSSFKIQKNQALIEIIVPVLGEVGSVLIAENETLPSFNFVPLHDVGSVVVRKNPSLIDATLSSVSAFRYLIFEDNERLESVFAPQLESLYSLEANGNGFDAINPLNINLPNLRILERLSLERNFSLEVLNFPSLTNDTEDSMYGSFTINGHQRLHTIDLPLLRRVGRDLIVEDSANLETLNLTEFRETRNSILLSNLGGPQILNFPNLVRVGDLFRLENSTRIEQVLCPAIESIGDEPQFFAEDQLVEGYFDLDGGLVITGNAALFHLNFPSLSYVGGPSRSRSSYVIHISQNPGLVFEDRLFMDDHSGADDEFGTEDDFVDGDIFQRAERVVAMRFLDRVSGQRVSIFDADVLEKVSSLGPIKIETAPAAP